MPELPEVETTCRGVAPHIGQQMVKSVIVRQSGLRWQVPLTLQTELPGHQIEDVFRRGKYLILVTAAGKVLIHLGMSGNLRIVDSQTPVRKHDHVDITFENGVVLRFNDARRFGCVLWVTEPLENHPLLASLGPEPLEEDFDTAYLYIRSRHRKSAIKSFIMDSKIVVGVGNIYANEALFMAGIHPLRAAGNISSIRYGLLVDCIRQVLSQAIEAGGTTLRDFVASDGKPGYFKQSLHVYGRSGLPCVKCQTPLREIRLGQRSTVYCLRCQR